MSELVGLEKFNSLESGKVLFFFSFSFLEKWKSFLPAKTVGSTNLFPTPSLAAPQI